MRAPPPPFQTTICSISTLVFRPDFTRIEGYTAAPLKIGLEIPRGARKSRIGEGNRFIPILVGNIFCLSTCLSDIRRSFPPHSFSFFFFRSDPLDSIVIIIWPLRTASKTSWEKELEEEIERARMMGWGTIVYTSSAAQTPREAAQLIPKLAQKYTTPDTLGGGGVLPARQFES